AKNSPGLTDSETLSTAVSAPSGVSNCLTIPSTVRIGSAARAGAGSRPGGIATTDMAGVTPRSPRRPATADIRPSLAGALFELQPCDREPESHRYGELGLLPLPTELGFTRVRHQRVVEVGNIRLRLGRGMG